jgi:hypothetical protein
MAAQTELAELKRAVQELNQKLDKQMVMVQGLVDLFTSAMSKPNLGLNAANAGVENLPQVCHAPTVGVKLCSRDMFKDLAEFHEARTHPKEDARSLFKTNAEREDMRDEEINPKGKRMHPVDEAMWCNCKANKGSSLDSRFTRRNPPRTFSCFSTPLASVYKKLLDAGSIKPLDPTPLPKHPPASFKHTLYCAYHQMPGHSTNTCFRLRHAIQDLIDHGIIPAPFLPKANVVPKPNSGSQIGQTSTISTQINPISTQINPTSTIFNPSHYIVPESQPKPLVSIPSEPEVNMTAVGWAVGVFTANIGTDSDGMLTKEKTDWQRSFNHESLGLLSKEFSQLGLAEGAEEVEALLGPDIL